MKTEIYKVTRKQSTNDIVEQEDLSTMGHAVVTSQGLCSIGLQGPVFAVSILVPTSVYEVIKNDTEFIVEEHGWWGTLSDDTVVLKRFNGEIIKPINIW